MDISPLVSEIIRFAITLARREQLLSLVELKTQLEVQYPDHPIEVAQALSAWATHS